MFPNEPIRLATVFSGIGAIEQAFKRLCIDHNIVFACDNGDIDIDCDYEYELSVVKSLSDINKKKEYVDKLYKNSSRRTNFVKKSYLANYKINSDLFFQDVKLLDGTDFRSKVDILVGGSPCQSFSIVGSQEGFEDTRGTLFHEFARLIDEIRPKVFIYENVRGLYTHDRGHTWKIVKRVFKELGYNFYYDILDSKDFGIPQTRRRVFVVGFREPIKFRMPEPNIKLKWTMQDFLIERNKFGSMKYNSNGDIYFDNIPGKIDDKYFLTPKLEAYVMKGGTKSFYQKPEIDLPIARTILSTMGNRHRAGIDNYVTVDGKIRMLSEREAHRLMGFPDDYNIVVSRAQGYRQAGNSIVVDVLMAILKQIINTGAFD